MHTTHFIHTIILSLLLTPFMHAGGSQTWSLLRDYRPRAMGAREVQKKLTWEYTNLTYAYVYIHNLYTIPKLQRCLAPIDAAYAVLKMWDPRISLTNIQAPCSHNAYTIGKQVIDNEQTYSDNYFFLYHAMSKPMYVLMCMNTYLDHITNGTPLSSDFIKLRTNDQLYDDKNRRSLQEYLRIGRINDWPHSHGGHLLATSLGFPTLGIPGESALSFFLRNDSAASDFKETFNKIISHYSLDTHTGYALYDMCCDMCKDIYFDSNGVLLQIGIPKDRVNQHAYMAKPCGPPEYLYNKDTGNQLSMYDILDLHQNNISQLSRHIEKNYVASQVPSLQARIRLDRSLCAEPGVMKVFTHNGFSQDKLDEMYHRINAALCPSYMQLFPSYGWLSWFRGLRSKTYRSCISLFQIAASIITGRRL